MKGTMTHGEHWKKAFGGVACALALALAASGCGGAGEQAATEEAVEAAPAVDLCGLLTAAEVEQVLGTRPGEPEPGEEALGQCTWASPGGEGPLVVLTLDKAVLHSFDDFVAAYGEEFGGEDPPRDRFHPVEGLGDWAMYRADDHMVRTFRGDRVLEVSAPSAEEAQVVELAKLAMSRLP